MRRDDHAIADGDLLEIDSGHCQLAVDGRGLRQINRNELVLVVTLDPFAIPLGVAIFELVVRNREDDGRLIADRGQRAGSGSGAVEQHDFVERKGALAQDRLNLGADERERIDDAEAVAGGGFRIDHCGAICSTSSALRVGNAIDQSRVSGPDAR